MASVSKGVSGRSSLQLSQLAAQVWWEKVWPCGCPLAPLDEGRACPFQSPHHQVQPALPLQAQSHCKGGCQACWGEEQQQVKCPATHACCVLETLGDPPACFCVSILTKTDVRMC